MKRILTCLIALVFSALACAQSLTTAQLTTARTFACADTGTARPMVLAGDTAALRGWFNTAGSYVVWRTNVTRDEVMRNAAFDWSRVDNLTAGKARIWDWMFAAGTINAAQANIRAGIDATWVGTAADLAVRAAVYAVVKRNALRVEQALATGTGTTATPGTMSAEGPLSETDSGRMLFTDSGVLIGC